MKILIVFTLLFSLTTFSQTNFKDSTINTLLIGINYKANFPGGDLAQRWGFSNHLGGDVSYKFKNNLTLELNGGFLFGKQLRDSSVFRNVLNSDGTITAWSGIPADVFFQFRGVTGHVSVGYVLNKFAHNPNSGIWISGGVGGLGHKIRIENIFDAVPQLEGDYKKGYDKLTVGVSTRQFIGYLYQADRRLFKFYGGIEFVQGFTKNIRTYNFSTGGPENEQRLDLTYGLKVGWVIPIYKRSRSTYYYN